MKAFTWDSTHVGLHLKVGPTDHKDNSSATSSSYAGLNIWLFRTDYQGPDTLFSYFLNRGAFKTESLPRSSVAQLIEALHYKPEGRRFDSRLRHYNFSLTPGRTMVLGSNQPLK